MTNSVSSSRAFSRLAAFDYLADKDRHLPEKTSPEFNIGVIGCGMMGQEHIRNTLLAGRACITGVFDPHPASIDHALTQIANSSSPSSPHNPPRVYRTLEEACADPDTQALFIATPNFTHLDVLRLAATSDKALFLEKPIATSVADAWAVCQIAAGHTKPVRFGLQYRYKAIYAEAAHEVFTRKSTGHVHSVNMIEHRFPFLDKVGQWNKFNDFTGGTLVEKCCHYFDLLNHFAGGQPSQVFAIGNQAVNYKDFRYDNKQADGLDQAQVSIKYDNGAIGGFSLSMFAPGTREELVVCGSSGRLVASEQARLGERSHNQVEVWCGDNGASRVITPDYPSYISKAGHHGSTFYEHLAFADQLSGLPATGASIADGFWSVLVGAAAQQSIAERRAVDIEELLPQDFSADVLKSKPHANDAATGAQ